MSSIKNFSSLINANGTTTNRTITQIFQLSMNLGFNEFRDFLVQFFNFDGLDSIGIFEK